MRAVVGHVLKTGGPTYVRSNGMAVGEKKKTRNEAPHVNIHRSRV